MDEPIAVIGLDARFPGDADTAERFYEFLVAGRSARTEVPPDRYNADAFWHPDAERCGSTRARTAHFLKGSVAAFDAPFFSITPTEAASMDPQQRGMLECVYHALENAGIPLERAAGTQTGVYVGCMFSDYARMMARDVDLPSKYALDSVASMLSNRVSWCFDLRGPSMTIDTACSSSLVALHQACNSLRLREASMAIVGGCNLILSPEFTLMLDAGGVLGPDGKSYSFDHRANGYARGEGFGAVVLKRVSDAIRDGDVIRAVVRGSGTNQDGRSPGIMQPTAAAQAELIRSVYDRSGLDFAETRFFEAHGTGTAVGDPIEAGAIAQVFAPFRSEAEPLFVGALKSNVGHVEGAAGVAAVIKGVLTLERGVIPANTWFEKKNLRIRDEWHLSFPTEAVAWPRHGLRRMSINSFGVGGSNAHVVMDDARHFLARHHLVGLHRTELLPHHAGLVHRHRTELSSSSSESTSDLGLTSPKGGDAETLSTTTSVSGEAEHGGSTSVQGAPQIFLLSAFDQDGVARLRAPLGEYLASRTGTGRGAGAEKQLARDLSYTLARRRTRHAWRSFSVASSLAELRALLAAGTGGSSAVATRAVAEPRLAFVFTGQGAQWPGMGRELMTYPVFRASLYEADAYLNKMGCSWSVTYELSKEGKASRVNDAEFSQPISLALQVALVDLLASWNVRPNAVVGHSSGEIAAAYAAGHISREQAWRVAYLRGKLSAALARSCSEPQKPPSGMAAVGLDSEGTAARIRRVHEACPEEGLLEIACFNSAESITVSGDVAKIDMLVEMCQKEGVFARKLNVGMAYHSSHMKPIAEQYRSAMGTGPGTDIAGCEAASQMEHPIFFSSSALTTSVAPSSLRSPDYWVNNLVSPVRFHSAVLKMLSRDPHGDKGGVKSAPVITDLLEIGPHGALRGPLRGIAQEARAAERVRYQTALKRGESGVLGALEAAGSLVCRGFDVDLAAANRLFNPDHVDAGTGAPLRQPMTLTDLPAYPFNHAREYWAESRAGRAHRLRGAPRHELLGALLPEFDRDPNNAVWHNYIRISEIPWAEHHGVAGDVLYPAAGMLVMAVEASRQLADPERNMRGFAFRDVSFHLALRVPAGDDDAAARGVESHFYLRPASGGDNVAAGTAGWSEFRLCTAAEDGAWREHCRGLVRTEYDGEDEEAATARQNKFAQDLTNSRAICKKKVHTDKVYRTLTSIGLDFGPSFRTLNEVRIGSSGGMVLARTASMVSEIHKIVPHGYLQPHLVHPATLDSVLQAAMVPVTAGPREAPQLREGPLVPVFVSEFWISAGSNTEDGGHDSSYTVSAEALADTERQEARASLTAVHTATGAPMVSAAGLVVKTIPGHATQFSREEKLHRPALHLEWRPDPTRLTGVEAARAFGLPMDAEDEAAVVAFRDCEALCLLYVQQFLKRLADESIVARMKPHHQRYVAWMRHVAAQTGPLDDIEPVTDESLVELEEKVTAAGSAEGRLLMKVTRALDGILVTGDVDPLGVIFGDDGTTEEVYRRGMGSRRCFAQLRVYLDALAHRNPNMRILEVGAGTGGATGPVLDTLGASSSSTASQGRRFDHYDFTDISPSFFEAARETFGAHEKHMSFRVLDLEKPASDQGFEKGAYDLVLAANVLHATKSMETTLRHVRDLLKPGTGKLVVHELTNLERLQAPFCFGLLPGWWLSEDQDRGDFGPLMPVDGWRACLSRAGFTGLDAVLHDVPEEAHRIGSVLVSTVQQSLPSTTEQEGPSRVTSVRSAKTYLLLDPASELQLKVGGMFAVALARQGHAVEMAPLANCSALDPGQLGGSTCMVLAELDTPILKEMTDTVLSALKTLAKSAGTLVWLGQGGESTVLTPELDLITGLARSIRAKKPDRKFVTISFASSEDTETVVNKTVQIFASLENVGGDGTENSFRVCAGGLVHVPRLVEAPSMTEHIRSPPPPPPTSMTQPSTNAAGNEKPTPAEFNPEASYVIAGGLGGLGRSIARWMASRGARNLILLSRSGPVREEAKELLADLGAAGVHAVAPVCDVTDAEALKRVIGECLTSMPPVKGCMQGSMLLKDKRFEDMTVEDWNLTVQSKVHASTNLHEVLAKSGLDFFVLLSTLVGVMGGPEQSNYAAGGTFQDALARSLTLRSCENSEQERPTTTTVSLDLPIIMDVGFVAAEPALMAQLRGAGWAYMEEDEFHAVLDYYCFARGEDAAGTDVAQKVTRSHLVPRVWLPQDTADAGVEPPAWARDPLFSHLRPAGSPTDDSSAGGPSSNGNSKDVKYAALLAGADSGAAAEKIVLEALLQKLSRVLSVDVTDLDPARPLHAFGVDSLVAVGLRAWLARELGADISVFEMTDRPSIAALAASAAERSRFVTAKTG